MNVESSLCCVLASDIQLQNVVRFCVDPGAQSKFGIDPTLNLGKFYMTLTTFTYSQVVDKTTGVSPTSFWTNFCLHRKEVRVVFYLFSTWVKLKSRFNDIIAIGTDGEVPIVQALEANLNGNAMYL